MRWHDKEPYDFSLVSTYFPVLLLVLRNSFCVLFIYFTSVFLGLPQQPLLMLTACYVYLDIFLMWDSHFDRATGHLCVCALAILTQQQQIKCGNSEALILIVCDLLWSACAGVEVIIRTTKNAVYGYFSQEF